MNKPPDQLLIRSGKDEDIPAVIELMRQSLGDGSVPRTMEFWRWKHRQNPFGPSPMALAFEDDRLVGVRLFLRWTFRTPSGPIQAVRAVDTATSPTHQGRGIFKRLTLRLVEELKRDGVAFVFNTPNSKSGPGYLKMGWRSVGRTNLWLKVRRPAAFARSWLRRDSSAGSPAPELGAVDARLVELLTAAQAAELPARCNAAVNGRRTALDSEYLTWRYQHCPAARYGCHSGDPRRALVLTRTRPRKGLKELALSELLFERTPRGFAAARTGIQAALAEQPSDYAIAALRQDAPEAALLATAGFVPLPSGGPLLTVRDLAAVAPHTRWGESALQASIGDLELF